MFSGGGGGGLVGGRSPAAGLIRDRRGCGHDGRRELRCRGDGCGALRDVSGTVPDGAAASAAGAAGATRVCAVPVAVAVASFPAAFVSAVRSRAPRTVSVYKYHTGVVYIIRLFVLFFCYCYCYFFSATHKFD